MHYEDFAIQIKPAPDGHFATYVSSPAGEVEGRLVLPATPAELRSGLRLPLESGEDDPRRETGGARHLAAEVPYASPSRSRKELGRELFEALLGGRAGALFHESLARIGPSKGLRLKLRFDLSDPRLVEVAALPWESLYSERLGGFLTVRRRTPIVRYVEVPRPAGPRPLPETLRILVLAASPRGLPSLDLAVERKKIEESWAGLDGVEVSFVEGPGREGLGNALRDAVGAGRPHHVLHLMGHGRTDPPTGEGELLLADDDGSPVPVRGEELARELADFPELRFVFLNACETGAPPVRGGDPFGGIAAALVRTGVQAVVAMQRPISDRAAIELSRVLYRRIAAGDSLDTALTEGRLALDRRRDTALEWTTPVLFSRLPDGRLFEPRLPGRRFRRRLGVAAALLAVLLGGGLGLGVALHTEEQGPCAETPSAEVRSLSEEAERSVDAGRFDSAARSLRAALEIDPHYAGAHAALGFVEMERGRYGAARESLSRALREQPGCSVHAFNLGSFHLLREEYEQAAQSLRRALVLDPGMTAASAALGRALYLLGGLDAAREVLETGLRRAEAGEAMADEDAVSSLHANLGRVALAQDEPEEAVEHLERSRALRGPDDPRRRELVPALADARAATGNASGACSELAELLPLGRNPLTPWERRAAELGRELGCPNPS